MFWQQNRKVEKASMFLQKSSKVEIDFCIPKSDLMSKISRWLLIDGQIVPAPTHKLPIALSIELVNTTSKCQYNTYYQ